MLWLHTLSAIWLRIAKEALRKIMAEMATLYRRARLRIFPIILLSNARGECEGLRQSLHLWPVLEIPFGSHCVFGVLSEFSVTIASLVFEDYLSALHLQLEKVVVADCI
jgi:hypothetical protein